MYTIRLAEEKNGELQLQGVIEVDHIPAVGDNVRTHLPATTVIVVSHRASTLSRFARILVLSGGQIVEDSANQLSGFAAH